MEALLKQIEGVQTALHDADLSSRRRELLSRLELLLHKKLRAERELEELRKEESLLCEWNSVLLVLLPALSTSDCSNELAWLLKCYPAASRLPFHCKALRRVRGTRAAKSSPNAAAGCVIMETILTEQLDTSCVDMDIVRNHKDHSCNSSCRASSYLSLLQPSSSTTCIVVI